MALPEGEAQHGQGRKAMNRLSTSRFAHARGQGRRRWRRGARYSTPPARIAPDWMTIPNSLPRSSLKFSRSPARIR